MNSNKSLSGEYLKKLYTENKLNDHLQTPENLKKLLNYELDCMGDTFDPDYSFEIIDFCIDKLKELEPIDEQKMNFLGQKIMLEAKEFDRQRKLRRFRGFTVAAAAIGLVIGVMFFSGEEGYAGKFDFVHSLLSQDKGEQLSLKTSDSTLDDIEMEDGHLPDKMPDDFSFLKSNKDLSTSVLMYSYTFVHMDKRKLKIIINDYTNDKDQFKNQIEINKHSSKEKTIMEYKCFYSSNHKLNSISWPINKKIYTLTGNFSFRELEDIVSLYLKENE